MTARLGLGSAPLGGLYEALDQETATTVVRAAVRRGIQLFDTAPSYGAGLAERRLGSALANIAREDYRLATKVGYRFEDRGMVADFSREGAWRSLSGSLERLATDRVDIAFIHDPDDHPDAAIADLYPGLTELRDQGVAGAVGVALTDARLAARFVREVELDYLLLAGRYTLLRQDPLHELFPLCSERGVKVILGGVFNSGILAVGARADARYDYAPPPASVLTRVRALEAACERYDVPLHVAALRFALAHPDVELVLVGAASEVEVDAAIAALDATVPPALWTELKAAELIDAAAPIPQQGDPIDER